MSDSNFGLDAEDDDDEAAAVGLDATPSAAHSTPPWVKAFGVAAALLALIFVGLHVWGAGFRSHGRNEPRVSPAVDHGAQP